MIGKIFNCSGYMFLISNGGFSLNQSNYNMLNMRCLRISTIRLSNLFLPTPKVLVKKSIQINPILHYEKQKETFYGNYSFNSRRFAGIQN
jgi:hypothetical protein